MADQDTTDTTTTAAGGPGLKTLIKAGVVLSVIVFIEVAAASFLLPSSEETIEIATKLAEAESAQTVEDDQSDAEEESSDGESKLPDEPMREVPLGSFHVLSYDPETGTSLNVDFELFGTVLADEESEFYTLFDSNQHRIKEQIVITMRSTEVTDLTDAGLGLIKRKILEKTNRALGKPLLHEAVFSDFSFVER